MTLLLKGLRRQGKIIRTFTILFVATLLFSFAATPAEAATISISPASGTYAGSFSFNVVIDVASGEQMAAVDLNIAYTGPVEFVTAANGVQNCTPSVNAGSGTVNVLCASLDYFQDGAIVRLTFVANGSGTANFTVSVADSDGTISSATGASYTVSGSGGQGGGGELPETALIDVKTAGVGTFLLSVGMASLLLGHVINRAPKSDELYEDKCLADKVK
ncbi:MAG: hypothetical protein QY318_02560 [Candidatus Dojkabacteria bacterium]|nr:MAG: hypothetical protein QY318_02560 [Candidatus Dojkabacteria bacterium]